MVYITTPYKHCHRLTVPVRFLKHEGLRGLRMGLYGIYMCETEIMKCVGVLKQVKWVQRRYKKHL